MRPWNSKRFACEFKNIVNIKVVENLMTFYLSCENFSLRPTVSNIQAETPKDFPSPPPAPLPTPRGTFYKSGLLVCSLPKHLKKVSEVIAYYPSYALYSSFLDWTNNELLVLPHIRWTLLIEALPNVFPYNKYRTKDWVLCLSFQN